MQRWKRLARRKGAKQRRKVDDRAVRRGSIREKGREKGKDVSILSGTRTRTKPSKNASRYALTVTATRKPHTSRSVVVWEKCAEWRLAGYPVVCVNQAPSLLHTWVATPRLSFRAWASAPAPALTPSDRMAAISNRNSPCLCLLRSCVFAESLSTAVITQVLKPETAMTSGFRWLTRVDCSQVRRRQLCWSFTHRSKVWTNQANGARTALVKDVTLPKYQTSCRFPRTRLAVAGIRARLRIAVGWQQIAKR